MTINISRGLYYQDFISKLCVERGVNTYLEIGVESGMNLSGIKVDTAFGVDPNFILSHDPTKGKRALFLYRMTSDAFFARHAEDIRHAGMLDFAFLDGMHLFEYLLRDIYNTELLCKSSGLITLHDCLPLDGEMVERVNNYAGRKPGPNAVAWTGDVWKIVPILEEYRPDLSVTLVDCAPTGLVCISGLDPTSTVLRDRYLEIASKFRDAPNDPGAIEDFYAKRRLTSASDVISNFNQSLYFKA